MADISENSCEIFMPSERSVAAPTSSAEFSDDHTPPPIEFSHNHSQLSLKRPNFVKASSSSTSPLSCKEADVSNDVNNLEQYPHNVPFLCNTTTAAAFVQPFLFNNPFLSTPFATYLPQNDVQSDFAGSNGGLNTDLPANSYSPSAAAATATEFYHRLLREYASRTTLTQSDASSLSMATTLQKQSLRNTDDVLPETLNVGLINNYSKPTVSSQSEQAKLPENAKSHSSSIILLTHTQSDSEPEKQTELSSSASSTFNGVRQSRNSVSPSLPDHCIPWENENILTVEPHSPAHLPNQVAVDEQNVIKSTDASLVDQPDFCKDLPERKDKLLINHNNNNVQSSSGRENKTTAMIHKQISEIEKELMRKTQNENIKKNSSIPWDGSKPSPFASAAEDDASKRTLSDLAAAQRAAAGYPLTPTTDVYLAPATAFGPQPPMPAAAWSSLAAEAFWSAVGIGAYRPPATFLPPPPVSMVQFYADSALFSRMQQCQDSLARVPTASPVSASNDCRNNQSVTTAKDNDHQSLTNLHTYSSSSYDDLLQRHTTLCNNSGYRRSSVPYSNQSMPHTNCKSATSPYDRMLNATIAKTSYNNNNDDNNNVGDVSTTAAPCIMRSGARRHSAVNGALPTASECKWVDDRSNMSSPSVRGNDDPVWQPHSRDSCNTQATSFESQRYQPAMAQSNGSAVMSSHASAPPVDSDTDTETDNLLGLQRFRKYRKLPTADQTVGGRLDKPLQICQQTKPKNKKKEAIIHEPAVLIEGVLFRAKYLGSTQILCDGRPTKASRMMQAHEAVTRIKVPEGESQPCTDVDLFISTEKIMVLNTDLQRLSETDVRQDIMMDHPLRTISYIADIADLVVLMARRVSSQASPDDPEPAIKRTPKLICHVFESEEARFIAQSIGQAFQVAYVDFLRANGIEDTGYLRELDYQEVLNSQEMMGEELELFARKETQKDVVVPKQKNEILGMVIVESGWGSMLPTVVVANIMPGGPAARCNQINVGDHIIALNGISFVGLPLATCQNHIKNVKQCTAIKMTLVHTPPVVEVRIKRPDTKYQLGFSVQNGVICSLLRGGIAERGGIRVGHRIIEINGHSVVAVPHEKVVTMLATAVGEIQMKTMPTSMFRLLTGQEQPLYI